MVEKTPKLVVGFRGQQYRIDLDHAHILNQRGHLMQRMHGYPPKVEYWVEDDRMIEVRGDPLSSGGAGK